MIQRFSLCLCLDMYLSGTSMVPSMREGGGVTVRESSVDRLVHH